MSLVVASNRPTRELKLLVEKYFGDLRVPSAQRSQTVDDANPVSEWWGKIDPFQSRDHKAYCVEIEPVKDDRKLQLSWPVWVVSKEMRERLNVVRPSFKFMQ